MVTSSGTGVYQAYNQGAVANIGLSPAYYYLTNVTVVPTNLTQVMLGADAHGAGGFNGGYFQGEIAFAAVFSAPLTTNMVAAVYRAVRWLEPETCNRVWLGDSQLQGGVTNCYAQFFQD